MGGTSELSREWGVITFACTTTSTASCLGMEMEMDRRSTACTHAGSYAAPMNVRCHALLYFEHLTPRGHARMRAGQGSRGEEVGWGGVRQGGGGARAGIHMAKLTTTIQRNTGWTAQGDCYCTYLRRQAGGQARPQAPFPNTSREYAAHDQPRVRRPRAA